jgi:hypothetical protein
MARRSPSSRKERRPRSPAKSLAKVQGLALDMEEPLNEVENLAQALRFIGYGLESHNDECGTPISALAWTALQRLSALREIWSRMIKASAGA